MQRDGDFNGLARPARENINSPLTPEGNTYLHELCAKGAPVFLVREAVLELGADMSALNRKKTPPLGLAIMNGNKEIIQCLIDLGAELYAPVGGGRHFNATAFATQLRNDEILKLVLDNGGGLHVNKPGIPYLSEREDIPCLPLAVKDYKAPLVEMLAAAGALFNQECGDGNLTPLQRMATGYYLAPVEKLISLGAEIDYQQSKNGMTALHYAVQDSRYQVVDCLLKMGADPNIQTASGLTPLMMCIDQSNFSIMNLLIASGADVNIKRSVETKETALHKAVSRRNFDMMKLLLEKGADPLLTDAFNQTARHYAKKEGYDYLATKLEEAENEAEQKFFEKAYKKLRR